MGAISLSSIKNIAGNLTSKHGGGIGGALSGVNVGGVNVGSITSQLGSLTKNSGSSGSSGGSSVLGGVASGAGSATSGIGGFVNSAGSEIGSAVSGAESYASNLEGSAVSGISNFLGDGVSTIESGIGDIASGVGSTVSGLFSSKKDSKASTLKGNGSDPLKTSTVKGTPKSTTFTASNQYSQTTPINLQTKQPESSGGVAGLGTIADRIGGSLSSGESGIMGLASGITHNSVVSGIYNSASSAVSSVSSTVGSVVSTASGLENKVSSVVSDFTKQYSGFFGGLADGSSQSLSSLIQGGLPGTADANGNPIDGVPTNVGSDKLDALYGAVKGIGCSIQDAPYTKYAAEQSFKGSLLGITSQLNMTDLFRQMTKCSQYQDANSIKNLAHVFTNQASKHPAIANIASQAVNDPSQTPISNDMAKQMVTNPDLEQKNVSDISDIFHRMNYNPNDAYSIPTNGSSSSTPVFDSDTLASSPNYMSTGLLGQNVGDVVNDVPLQ